MNKKLINDKKNIASSNIFLQKKTGIFSILGRIPIHIKMKWIQNTGKKDNNQIIMPLCLYIFFFFFTINKLFLFSKFLPRPPSTWRRGEPFYISSTLFMLTLNLVLHWVMLNVKTVYRATVLSAIPAYTGPQL